MKNEITRTKFRKFIFDKKLTRPKTKIAKHFGISVSTLYHWMRKNGFEELIGVGKGGINDSRPKKKEFDRNIEKDQHSMTPINIDHKTKLSDEEAQEIVGEAEYSEEDMDFLKPRPTTKKK